MWEKEMRKKKKINLKKKSYKQQKIKKKKKSIMIMKIIYEIYNKNKGYKNRVHIQVH